MLLLHVLSSSLAHQKSARFTKVCEEIGKTHFRYFCVARLPVKPGTMMVAPTSALLYEPSACSCRNCEGPPSAAPFLPLRRPSTAMHSPRPPARHFCIARISAFGTRAKILLLVAAVTSFVLPFPGTQILTSIHRSICFYRGRE